MHSDIVKFVITGLPRTGTTLIGCSLLDHPEVLYYGELFHILAERRAIEAKGELFGPNQDYKHKPYFEDYEIRMCNMDESGYNYLNYFYDRNVPYKAIGFKILYTQGREGPNSEVWRYISDHPEIKIINTQRKNILDIMVSVARAERSYIWHTNQDFKFRKFRIKVDIAENVFNLFERLSNETQSLIQSHEVLNIEYNKMSFQETIASVFSFLGVSQDIKTTPKLKKIANCPPNEELINYQELKEYFQNTRFAKYFVY